MILNENDLRDKINKISRETDSDIVFIDCSNEDYKEYKKLYNYEYQQSSTNDLFYYRYKDIVEGEEYFRHIGLNMICVIFLNNK